MIHRVNENPKKSGYDAGQLGVIRMAFEEEMGYREICRTYPGNRLTLKG